MHELSVTLKDLCNYPRKQALTRHSNLLGERLSTGLALADVFRSCFLVFFGSPFLAVLGSCFFACTSFGTTSDMLTSDRFFI